MYPKALVNDLIFKKDSSEELHQKLEWGEGGGGVKPAQVISALPFLLGGGGGGGDMFHIYICSLFFYANSTSLCVFNSLE